MIFLVAYTLAALAGVAVVLLGARVVRRRREVRRRRIAEIERMLRELPTFPPGLEPRPGWQQRVLEAIDREIKS